MARVKQNQTNATSGVIAPIAISRDDVAFYYNGLEDARNLEVLPSGGMRRRAGLQFVKKMLRDIAQVPTAGATVTAPQGGTAASVHDGNSETFLETANNLAAINPFVIAKFDFTVPVTVDAVDVLEYKLSSGILDDELCIQYSEDDAAWFNYAGAFNADVTDRSRRLRSGVTVTARYWRFVRIGATNLAAKLSVCEIKFYAQTADLPVSPRLIPFAYSTVEAYMMAVTPQNIDVFVGDAHVGSVGIPHTDAMLPILNWAQSLDTLILWHPEVRPQRIFRQGGDDEFDFHGYQFEKTPQYDYGAGVGGTDEVQLLNDAGGFTSGSHVTILLEGERTVVIRGGATRADTAGVIQQALRDLANTSVDGITVTDSVGGDGFIVTFGGDDGKQPWGAMSVSVQSGNSVWTTTRTTKGQLPGEDIMSDSRGWPRCGLFAQQRLVMAGLKGVPNSIICSFVGDPLDLDIDKDDPSKALMFRPDSEQVGAVYQIAAGRNLCIFSDDGESYFADKVIKEETAIVQSTQSGSKEGMRVHGVEGAWLFMQGVSVPNGFQDREIGTSVQEFIFSETVQDYQSNIISKLSSHLIKNPIDSAMLKGITAEDPAIMMLINEDGTATAYTALRNELVNAFMPQTLGPRPDKFKAVGVDKRRNVFFCTERLINGEWVQYLERYNEKLLLDCGNIVSIDFQLIEAGADGQASFTWTMDNPVSSEMLGLRLNGARLAPEDFTVDLGTKTVTLSPELAADIKGPILPVPGVKGKAGDIIRVSSMVKVVTGVEHLEGETIQTYVDGSPSREYIVSGGTFELDDYADTEIQYGFNFEVYARMMPFRLPGAETLAGEKMRVIKAVLSLYETGSVEIRANGGRWHDVPLQKFDTPVLDKSLDQLLFTGEKVLQGLKGHAQGGYLEFRQTIPSKLTIRSVVREVSL